MGARGTRDGSNVGAGGLGHPYPRNSIHIKKIRGGKEDEKRERRRGGGGCPRKHGSDKIAISHRLKQTWALEKAWQ